MSSEFMNEKRPIGEVIKPWVIASFQGFMADPEAWPIRADSRIEGYKFWAGLEIREINYKGSPLWLIDACASYGPNANVEYSMTMRSGSKDDLVAFMQKELDDGVRTPRFYIRQLCDKVQMKGDDYHSDYW